MKAPGLRHASTLCGSSSGSVNLYIRFLYYFWCTLLENDPQRVEACRSSRALIVKLFVGIFSNFDRIQLTLMSQLTKLQVSIAVKVNITVWYYTA